MINREEFLDRKKQFISERGEVRKWYSDAFLRASSRFEVAVFAIAITGLLIPLKNSSIESEDSSNISVVFLSTTLLISKRFFRGAVHAIGGMNASRIDEKWNQEKEYFNSFMKEGERFHKITRT